MTCPRLEEVQMFIRTSLFVDAPHSRLSITNMTPKIVEAVRLSFLNTFQLSARKLANILELSLRNVRQHLHLDFKVVPHQMMMVQ